MLIASFGGADPSSQKSGLWLRIGRSIRVSGWGAYAAPTSAAWVACVYGARNVGDPTDESVEDERSPEATVRRKRRRGAGMSASPAASAGASRTYRGRWLRAHHAHPAA